MSLFMTKEQIGTALETSPGVAAALLAEKGVKPVDWGRGRSRGLRWYAPAVEQAAREMHEDAQGVKPSACQEDRAYRRKPGLIQGRSVDEIMSELTRRRELQ